MHRTEPLVLFALVSLGCSVRLDELPEARPAKNAPLAAGCPLLAADGSALDGVWGRARRTRIAGAPAWVVDSTSSFTGATLIRGTSDDDPCRAQGSVTLSSAWLAGTDAAHVAVLDVVNPAGAPSSADRLYYRRDEPDPTAPFGIKTAGFGIASFDDAAGGFMPSSGLLWSGDRPSFGVAAIEQGGTTWAFGCRDARFLDADCWLASAPTADAEEPSAYRYARGGGNSAALLDDAFPLLSASTSISVAFLPDRQRFLMAYVPPLGDSILLRTGLDIDGPWSAPVEAARCALPAGDAYCGDVTLHADLPRALNEVQLSYAIATFDGAARLAHPERYRTRLAKIGIPSQLP